MHVINDGMTTDAVCTTTGGPWNDRRKKVFAAIGIGTSPKRKAEIREQRDAAVILMEEDRHRFEEKQANEVLREKRRLQQERHDTEQQVVERLRKDYNYEPSYGDDDGQNGLPPWQRTTPSREIIEKERNEPPRKRRPSWDDDGKNCLPPWQRTTPSREIIEKEINEPPRKEGSRRRPSWDDDGRSCLPPWQR